MEEYVITAVEILGLPAVLFVVFTKGMIVGKPFPTVTTIFAYAVIAGITSPTDILLLTSLTALFSTLGGITLYIQTQRDSNYIQRIIPNWVLEKAKRKADEKKGGRISKVKSYFEGKIGASIFVSNVITGARHLMTIPAAKQEYPIWRFIIITYVSTFIYHSVLTITVVVGAEAVFNLVL